MDKEDIVYIQWNITHPYKEWNNAVCSNMDGPRGYLTKRNKPDSQISYVINLYVESKKKDTNVLSFSNHCYFFYHLQLNLILTSITDSW